MALRGGEKLGAARPRHHRPGRVLVRREGVDEPRRTPLARHLVEGLGEAVGAHPVAVHGNPDHLDAERPVRLDGAVVGELLEHHPVAASLAEGLRDEGDPLHRAVGEDDVVGIDLDPFPGRLAGGEEAPETFVSELAGVGVEGRRELRNNAGRGGGERLAGVGLRIGVAGAEIVRQGVVQVSSRLRAPPRAPFVVRGGLCRFSGRRHLVRVRIDSDRLGCRAAGGGSRGAGGARGGSGRIARPGPGDSGRGPPRTGRKGRGPGFRRAGHRPV